MSDEQVRTKFNVKDNDKSNVLFMWRKLIKKLKIKENEGNEWQCFSFVFLFLFSFFHFLHVLIRKV